MEIHTIQTSERSGLGTRNAMKERAGGRLPGVLYGHGEAVQHFTVDTREFETAIRHHDRVFNLVVGGRPQRALLKDMQFDVLGDHPVHADFMRITADEVVTVDVEIEFVGHPKGASKGGRFIHPVTAVLVECKPENIPEKIEVRVGDLDVGEGLHVSDLELPEGVTCTLDPSVMICSVHAPGGGAEEGEESEEGAAEGGEPEVIGRKDEESGEDS